MTFEIEAATVPLFVSDVGFLDKIGLSEDVPRALPNAHGLTLLDVCDFAPGNNASKYSAVKFAFATVPLGAIDRDFTGRMKELSSFDVWKQFLFFFALGSLLFGGILLAALPSLQHICRHLAISKAQIKDHTLLDFCKHDCI
jgi:hypothetical protein